MRRVVPVVIATAGGLALLANFHTTPLAPPPSTTESTAGVTTAPPLLPTAGSAETGSTTTTVTRTISGPDVLTRYGDVQVKVVLQGARLVDVQALQLPYDRSKSARISQEAGPQLRSEALRAQSANIDVVSGATYTSEGYAQSLQGALDRAPR